MVESRALVGIGRMSGRTGLGLLAGQRGIFPLLAFAQGQRRPPAHLLRVAAGVHQLLGLVPALGFKGRMIQHVDKPGSGGAQRRPASSKGGGREEKGHILTLQNMQNVFAFTTIILRGFVIC